MEDTTLDLDNEEIKKEELRSVPKDGDSAVNSSESRQKGRKKQTPQDEKELVLSCLSNRRVTVRFVPKQTGIVTDPKHILYGGMAEGAVRYFTLPRLNSGMYVNALTDNEKAYLEEIMGLEYNALSIYRKVDNYWDNLQIRLTKQDTYLNLANPDDYIKYKVLLCNKDYIAASLSELQDKPKATYQFVLLEEGEETRNSRKNMTATMNAYMKFGSIQEEPDVLRVVIEAIDGKPMAKTTKLEFLQEKVNNLIQANPKLFLQVVEDPLLNTKVLIKRAVEEGLISNRGGMLYLKTDGSPLCEDNEEPTLSIAARFLSSPKRQELKFALEAKLKQ